MSTETLTRTETRTDMPSMWKVILHNDDFTPMDFVVQVLTELFNKSEEEAMHIMLTVHYKGKATVNLYPKDIAQTKVAQTVKVAEQHGHPMKATAEVA